jgi:hypothetical protein
MMNILYAELRAVVAWLLDNLAPEESVPGAVFVGNGRGTLGSDWDVYDAVTIHEAIVQEVW